MDWISAVILGIVEGFTEFLPISSTGHMILVGHWLQYQVAVSSTLEVVIQMGAMMAVVVLFWSRWKNMVIGWGKGEEQARREVELLMITTLPALVAGFLIHGFIKRYLFSPWTVAIGLAVGGVVMILVERWMAPGPRTGLTAITKRDAWRIGLFQCLAMWPGVSRSAATMIGGMTGGLDRKTSAEYSFMAAVPVMFAASAYDLYKNRYFLSRFDIPVFAIGLVVAFVCARLSIKWLIHWVSGHSLASFGWYRIVLAGLVWILLLR